MSQRKLHKAEQLMKNINYSLPSISPDNLKLLFASDEDGVPNVFEMDIFDLSVAKLTDYPDPSYPIGYLPDCQSFLFTSDQGGNEQDHIFLNRGEETISLTESKAAKASFLSWNKDRSGFYYLWNKRDPRFFDLWYMDLQNLEPRSMYENNGFVVSSVSRDGEFVALNRINDMNDGDVYVYDVVSKTKQLISEHSGDARHYAVAFSSDSSSLYFLTDYGHEFMYLKKYELKTQEDETVAWFDWDISMVRLSSSGRYLALVVNSDGRSVLRIRDLLSDEEYEVNQLPEGQVMSLEFSADGRFLTFVADGSSVPGDVYLLEVDTGSLRRMTEALNPEVSLEDLVEATVERFDARDGLPIPGILYRPHNASEENRVPAVVFVHGGPGGQSVLSYRPMFQLLVNHGFAVFCVNNRGSSGYGKSFFRAADHKHGEIDLDDCVSAKEYLASLDFVDSERIGIIGGSYGGYMVLAALAFRPDVFTVGVDIFGVSNWLRTLREMPAWWGAERNALLKKIGDPETEEDHLRRISPLFHADKIKNPLLVIQGANDPRVLKVESDEIVEKVRNNGVEVEYLVFDDEGHGFRKKKNQIQANDAVVEFLKKHL